MNKMNKIKKICLAGTIALIFLGLNCKMNAKATQLLTDVVPGVTSEVVFENPSEEQNPQVPMDVATSTILYISGYTVSNDKIVPGEDFTLSFTVNNSSRFYTAKEVLVNVECPEGVAPVYGTVGQIFLGDIKPGTSKEISLQYNSYNTITEDSLKFYIAIVSNQRSNSVEVRVPVGAAAPINVVASNIPNELIAGQRAIASVALQVMSKKDLQEVSYVLMIDEQEKEAVNLGVLAAGVTKTQTLTFQMDTPGLYSIKMLLKYKDENGEDKDLVVGNTTLSVVEPGKVQQTGFQENSYTDYLMIASSIAIVILFGVLVIVLKKKR